MEINNHNNQEQINPTIKLMEEEADNKVEDNTTNNWISDKDKSVELVGNPFMLTEEVGWDAKKIYFEKYADASPENILGQVRHCQSKSSLIITYAKDLENKINDH
eukprot:1198998-Ditylum_brightwellii.AAC.1